jgi:hypothetical protein
MTMPAPLTEEQRSQIIKLRKENKTQKAIADKLGIHWMTVAKFLQQKGMGGRADTNHDEVPEKPKRKTEIVEAPIHTQPPPLPETSDEWSGANDTMVGRLNMAIHLLQTVVDELEKLPKIR